MQLLKRGLPVLLWLAVSSLALAADPIPAAEAGKHIGKHTTVCGVVASAKYARTSRGAPTFLNLGRPYPNQDFTGVIWGSDRLRFSPPPETLLDKNICITGAITPYRGKPQIIVADPSQIEVRPRQESQ